MKNYYPLMLDLSNRLCIVIGGGKVAERKIETLVEGKAKVKVVSPVVTARIDALALKGIISWENRGYTKGDLEGFFLIIAATDNKILNKEVYQDVNHGVQFVNVVDSPDLCTFIVPSSVNRGNLHIAISTHGASPGLAKKIRLELEKQYGEEYVQYTAFLAKMREWVLENNLDSNTRREYFEYILEPKWFEKIKNGEREQAEAEILSIFAKKN